MKVYLSNRHEILLKHYKENKAHEGRHMLVLPHAKNAFWIADPALTLNDAVETLSLALCGKKIAWPDEFAMLVAIEKEIRTMNLDRNLGLSESHLFSLAKQLARLFARGEENTFKGWINELWLKLKPSFAIPPMQKSDINVHLFGFHSLSRFHFSFFKKVALHTPLFFYHLSPCREFWSDLKVDLHDEYPFNDHENVLAHLGKIGRRFAFTLEESHVETIEDYDDRVVNGEGSALAHTQSQLLTLEKDPAVVPEDDSMQIHSYSSKYHEIEGLYHFIDKCIKEKKCAPHETCVFAPNINEYAPFIRSLFATVYPYQIEDIDYDTLGSVAEGVTLLINLEKKRWSAPALLELMAHPLFQKKQNWRYSDILKIRADIERGHIRWGYDADHVACLIAQPFIQPETSWKQGIARLQAQEIDVTSWAPLIDALYEDTRILHSSTCASPLHWHEVLQKLSQKYFGQEMLSELPLESPLTFSTYWFFLQQRLTLEKKTIFSGDTRGIKFATLEAAMLFPAKCVALIGMNDEAYPRKEKDDLDRQALLEALLSARDKFYISYVGLNLQDHTPLPASALLIHFNKIKTTIHAPPSFDSSLPAPNKKTFALKEFSPSPQEVTLDLYALTQTLRYPLKGYFQHELQITLPRENTIKADEDFVVTPLTLNKTRRDLIISEKKENFHADGSLLAVATLRKTKEITCLKKVLEKHLIKTDEMKTVFIEKTLLIDGVTVHLKGRIEGVSGHTLIVNERDDFKGICKCWVNFLALNAFYEPCEILFTLSNKKKKGEFGLGEALEALKKIIQYHFYCLKHPSPLFPDWLEALLKGDERKMKQAIDTPSFDLERNHFCRVGTIDAKEIIHEWQDKAMNLFGKVYNEWM